MSKPKAATSRWPVPPRTAAVLLVIAFLIVVSSALADEGAILRRNVSGTPVQETENAQLSVAQFYIDAQRANGTLVAEELVEQVQVDPVTGEPILDDKGKPIPVIDSVTGEPVMVDGPGALQYFAETGDPDNPAELGRDFSTNEDLLLDERTVAKPMVITYYDQVELDEYSTDGSGVPVPENASLASIGGNLAKAVDDAFDAEASASGGVPDPEHRFDAYASVSFDDGETWKKYDLSESALRSSFTLEDGTVYPGTVDYGVKSSMAGNKIVVVWHSKYAMQGSPRYSLKAYKIDSATGKYELDAEGEEVPVLDEWGDPMFLEYLGKDGQPVRFDDPDFATKVVYYDHPVYTYDGDGNVTSVSETPLSKPAPLDIWGVAGSQNSIDYTEWMHHGLFPFAEVGEVPFSSIWTCRGVIQQTAKRDQGELVYKTDETGAPTDELEMVWDVKWRKAERLTSGKRDAMYTAIDGAENAGFAIVWQEDPTGLRPGYGEGPGEGWSGSTANHKTDLWYSYITWDEFDKVENPLADDDYWNTPEDNYLQTPEQVDELGWNTVLYEGVTDEETGESDKLTTNKPQVYERFSMPRRITDNNNIVCVVDGSLTIDEDQTFTANGGELISVDLLTPVIGGSEDGIEKVTDLYAWLDLDENGTPDMVAAGFAWTNSQDRVICNAVTEDGRLMNGQQWSTRTRMMMEGYDRADGTRGAWVLMGYEDSKGLGPGEPVDLDLDGKPDEVQPEPGDIGKVTKVDTFEFADPSFAKPGHMICAPDLGNPGYEIESISEDGVVTTVPPITGLVENDAHELMYATAIARRPALFVNPITKLELVDGKFRGVVKMEGGMTSAVVLYKEGTMRQGGPADIMMRRWVVPNDFDATVDNPFALENLVVDLPDDYEGFTHAIDDDPNTDDVVPIWRKDWATGNYLEPEEFVAVDSDGDGWDTEIVNGGLSRSAFPSFDGGTGEFTSEYYPNGVMVRGAQNMSGTIPLDVRPQDSAQGDTQTAAETIPAWHLDIMPDLAVKIDDGTLSYTDCYSCHADSWGVNPDDPDAYPAHGILDRVWWWTQTDGSPEVNDKIWNAATEVNIDPDTGDSGTQPELSMTRDELDAWGATQYDQHWKNSFELSKGHRGHIDGQDVMVMFGYAPNWLQSHYGKEPINLFVRRSFDGGNTWTTTPGEGTNMDGVAYNGDGTTYSQVQGTGSEEKGRVFFYEETYEAGEFERARNVSQFYSAGATIIDPRYSPTNMRRQTSVLRKLSLDQTEADGLTAGAYNPINGRFNFEQLPPVVDTVALGMHDATTGALAEATLGEEQLAAARPDDIRDPSKFFAVYESGDSGPMREGYEAAAENLFYSRATNWGDDWEDVLWIPNDEASKTNPDANTEPYYYWDWLETKSDDRSGEAAVGGSAGGQCFYATWNQWKEDEETGHEYDFDAIFRRCYWVPDSLRETVFLPVEIIIEPEELTAAEGEVVTLTATPEDADLVDRLVYYWDLDGDGSAETKGQTVTFVATGAMQHVTAYAKDRTSGKVAADDTWINSAVMTPLVWNIKTVGNPGLAGTRVALSANFRSPGQRWNKPAPADFDDSVTAVIDWGDGVIEPGAIASRNDGKGSNRFVVGEHKYKTPGLYTVKVTVTNVDGNTGWNYLEYAVIVHRKAGALSIKGTFNDPNGAGVATVAANVKYKVKGKYPSGKAAFVLGDMTFVSEKLDWMAVHGRKAWVRGQGQVNGVGGYEFLIAVVDDRKNVNDLIRVKIWKANGKMETVVYDSQPGAALDALAITELKDGKITIPLFKGKSWMRIRGLIK